MAEIKIISVNCQGLNDHKKRKDIFQYYRQQHCSILCLIDTHFTMEMEQEIRNEWGYEARFNSFTSNSRGVAILFNNNFEYQIHEQPISDNTGNLLALSISLENKKISLICIYGPNDDSPDFYQKLGDTITKLNNEEIIIVGDFNLVLDTTKDYFNYLHVNNPKAREAVLEQMLSLNLVDIYREFHPNVNRFTWRKPNPMKQARLDFFLISASLLKEVKSSDIMTSYRSDHSPVYVSLKLNNFKHGKGLWKFNNSLLKDIEYIKCINNHIDQIKQQYAVPVYERESVLDIPAADIQFIINEQLFLETLLMEIRSKTISYASHIKKQRSKKEKDLQDQLEELERDFERNIETINEKKKDLENIRNHKVNGCMVRSRAKWINEGEKPSNYFLNLENRHFTNKIIPKVIIVENDVQREIIKQEDILMEVENFYRNLYSSNRNINEKADGKISDILKDFSVPKLSDGEKKSIEGYITHKEASIILKDMSNNKSPGSDGFTAEFFKIFWKKIGFFVVRSLNYGFDQGELSSTQKQGIITCIPKEGKSKFSLNNWRPISLLNVTYKIGSGCIARRIKTVLSKIISNDQTGFIPGRYIGENSRLIYDLMNHTETNHIPGVLVMIDFEKAFDSVSWKFIKDTLQYFNFGPYFCSWITTFHYNAVSCVTQAGFLSNFFKLGRGCRQGDPLSPYIFLLCAEILAIKIKNNRSIKGILINNTEYLMSQYADDTSIILDGSEVSLRETLKELDEFYKLSGLKINRDKTQIVWIGSKKYSDERLCSDMNFKWTTRFKLLGIHYDVDLNKILKLNYDKKLVKIKSIIDQWSKRKLTPIGKITLVKSLLISQLNHLFIALPNPKNAFIKELNTILFEFVWNSKSDKIKRKVATQKYAYGGLKMVDLDCYIKGLKSTWIRRLVMEDNSKWKSLLRNNVNLDKLINTGSDYILQIVENVKNDFWKDVMVAFKEIQEKVVIKSWEDYMSQPLWNNHKFKIESQSIFYKTWYDKGIKNVHDLLDEKGEIINFKIFKDRFNLQMNFLTYMGITQVVATDMKKYNFTNKASVQKPLIPLNIKLFVLTKKGSKPMYDTLNKSDAIPTGKKKWSRYFITSDNQWKAIFYLPFLTTLDSKLLWFQYRVNHHILTTNSYMYKLGRVDSKLCTFCDREDETIYHLLWDCPKVQQLLSEFIRYCNSKEIEIEFDVKTFIFGDTKQKHFRSYNALLIIIKKYIYRNRCQKNQLTLKALINDWKQLYQINLDSYKERNELDKFKMDWEKWSPLVN